MFDITEWIGVCLALSLELFLVLANKLAFRLVDQQRQNVQGKGEENHVNVSTVRTSSWTDPVDIRWM